MKIKALLLSIVMVASLLIGCGPNADNFSAKAPDPAER